MGLRQEERLFCTLAEGRSQYSLSCSHWLIHIATIQYLKQVTYNEENSY